MRRATSAVDSRARGSDSSSSTSARGVTLTIRCPDIDFSNTARIWDSVSAHKSLFYSAFSVVGPPFEKIACRAMRMIRERVSDATLLAELRDFMAQEAMHAKLHARYNEQFMGQHYAQESQTIARILELENAAYYRLSEIDQVAVVVAAEHLIARFGHWIVRPAVHATMAPELRRLLIWHSLEELEHSSVTFDIYTHVYGAGWRAYYHRAKGLFLALRFLLRTIYPIYRILLAKEQRVYGFTESLRGALARNRRVLHFMVVQSGPVLSFLSPRHRPWTGNFECYRKSLAAYEAA